MVMPLGTQLIELCLINNSLGYFKLNPPVYVCRLNVLALLSRFTLCGLAVNHTGGLLAEP